MQSELAFLYQALPKELIPQTVPLFMMNTVLRKFSTKLSFRAATCPILEPIE